MQQRLLLAHSNAIWLVGCSTCSVIAWQQLVSQNTWCKKLNAWRSSLTCCRSALMMFRTVWQQCRMPPDMHSMTIAVFCWVATHCWHTLIAMVQQVSGPSWWIGLMTL